MSWIGKPFASVSLFAKNISNYPVRPNNRVEMQNNFKYFAIRQNTVYGVLVPIKWINHVIKSLVYF